MQSVLATLGPRGGMRDENRLRHDIIPTNLTLRTLAQAATNENVSPVVIKKLMKDIREFEKDKPEGITLEINDDNLCDIQAVMTGPGATNPTAKQLRASC